MSEGGNEPRSYTILHQPQMEETKSRFNRICVFCGSSSGKKASYQCQQQVSATLKEFSEVMTSNQNLKELQWALQAIKSEGSISAQHFLLPLPTNFR
ncbi:hypothetical protein VNO77_04128 [Canavalia gladiata]|uniref:Uncharacterized protein n=1 Tax=Canavalia gladiata TaxID=3824 RepID=A0AAN9R7I0_CANGL